MFLIPHNSIAKLRNGKASLVDNYVNLLPSAFYISITVLPIHRQSNTCKNISLSDFCPIHDKFKVINKPSYHYAKLMRFL